MSSTRKTINEKLGDLMRRLASTHDGELVATAYALRRMLKSNGQDLHDLAARIEKPPTLTDDEMQKIFDAGFAAGIRKARLRNMATVNSTLLTECLRGKTSLFGSNAMTISTTN